MVEEYKATITTNTSQAQLDLSDLALSLRRTNWYLRTLGLSPELRKSISTITQAMFIFRMVQGTLTEGFRATLLRFIPVVGPYLRTGYLISRDVERLAGVV